MNELSSIISAAAVPVNTGDRLNLVIYNTDIASANLVFRYLTEDETGNLTDNRETFTAIPNDQNLQAFALTAGRFLTASLQSNSSPLPYGSIYAILFLLKPGPNNALQRIQLTAGFVTTSSGLIYPLGIPTNKDAIIPVPTVENVPDPAAGSPIAYALPAGVFGEVIYGSFEFIASAAVANRTIVATLSTPIQIPINITGRTVITAGQTRRIVLWPWNNIPADNSSAHYLPWPIDIGQSDYNIDITATGIDIADQFSLIEFARRVVPTA